MPHAPFVSEVTQCPVASQQPLGHEFTSQTHSPVVGLHSWPGAHAPHATPLAPQAPFDSLPMGSQVVPLQQPLQAPPPQVHTPPEHACPEAQVPHALPLVPQWLLSWLPVSTQMLPLQQPPAHDVGVHVHVPLVLSQA